MSLLRKIVCVVHAYPGSNINQSTHPRISCLLQGLWSSFMWISLGLPHGIVLVGKSMDLSLLMITQDTHGCFSSSPRTRQRSPSLILPNKHNASLTKKS